MTNSTYISEELEKFKNAKKYYQGGDYGKAFTVYHELALLGSSSSQSYIGWMYFFGKGVEKNIDDALNWLDMSARAGDVSGQFGLAQLYELEIKDYDAAMSWYKVSAKKDYAPSIYRMALLYMNGKGVKKDKDLGVELLKEAMNKGNIIAERDYAIQLIRGYSGFMGRFIGWFRFIAVIIKGSVLTMRDADSVRLEH